MRELLGFSTAKRFVFVLLTVCLLCACAGSDKHKPVDLGANTPLLGISTAWTSSVGKVAYPLHVQVVGDSLFLADSQGVVASIDARTGSDVWRTALGVPLSAGVGSDGRYASVVSRTNELITLDAGREIWRQKLGAVTLTSPLVAGARVFALSTDRTVSAFDAASGRKLWQQQRTGDALILGQASIIMAVGDTLVVGLGGRLVGMNPQNGSVRWDVVVASSRGTNEVERLVDLVAGVSRVGDQVCVRAFQSNVACIDLTAAKVVWSKSAAASTGLNGDDSMVVGSEGDGKVIAWRRADGEKLWSSERLRFRMLSPPLLVGRSVVIGDDSGTIHFLSRVDGAPLNRLPTDGSPAMFAPVLVGQTLVVITQRGGIFGFRPD